MYKTVIFDMDGTLVDTDYDNMLSLKKAILKIEGRDIDIEEVKKTSGMPGLKCLEALDVIKIDETFKEWDLQYFKLKDKSEFFKGIVDTLDELIKRNVYIGIVTSRSSEEYDSFFSHLGLDKWFSHIVYSSDTELHKPHPQPLLHFLKVCDRDYKDAIYIGDTIYDRDAATSAKMDFALAGWSKTDVECKLVLEKPSDILGMVF